MSTGKDEAKQNYSFTFKENLFPWHVPRSRVMGVL